MKSYRAVCHLCGQVRPLRLVHVVPKSRFAVVGCRECDFVFCVEWPLRHLDHVQLERPSTPPEQQQEYWGTQFLEDEYALAFLYEPELRGYLDLLARQRTPGTLLDVGCSFGAFVQLARERGWDAEGIDTSAAAIAFGTKRLGVPLRTGDALRTDLRLGHYDVITILDVIEHQLDPGPFLSRLRSLLAPGGLLLVETPDHDSLYNVLYGWYNSTNNMLANLTRGRWDRPLPMYYSYEHENLYQSGHVLHFTAHTLEKLLAGHGFRLVEMLKQFSNIDYLVARNRSATARLAFRAAHGASRLLRRPNKLVAVFQSPGVTPGNIPQ